MDRDPREEATRRGKGAGVFQGFGAAELLRWGQALGRRSDGESKGGPETGWWGQTSQAGYATRRSQGKFSQRFTLWGHVARQNAQGPLGCCVENSLEAAGAERGRAPRGRREVERCSRGGGGWQGCCCGELRALCCWLGRGPFLPESLRRSGHDAGGGAEGGQSESGRISGAVSWALGGTCRCWSAYREAVGGVRPELRGEGIC